MVQAERRGDGAGMSRGIADFSPMNLAAEPSFGLGPWQVHPSRGEIEAPGATLKLEPKVMQVLLVLARIPGRTVSREELIAAAWPGRIVTDDAVQRCIAALRRGLRTQPGVDVETLPKLGYALRIEAQPVARAAAVAPAAAAPTLPSPVWRRTPAMAVAGAAAVVAAIGAAWIAARDESKSAGATTTVAPLTSLRGREVQPALSPAGGQVAFVWSGESGANPDIYVKAIGSDALLRLTSDPARDSRPTWSPDGAEIAFVRAADDGCTILRVPAIGGAERRIGACTAPLVRALDWSPDGRTLLMTAASSELAAGTLALIDVATGRASTVPELAALGANVDDARFSPDGRALAFAVSPALGVEDLYVLRWVDRDVRRVTFDRLKIHGFDWAADSRSLVMSSNRGGPFALWRVNLADLALAPLGAASEAADDPTIAGARLVYEAWREDTDLVRYDLRDRTVAPRRLYGSTRVEWDAQVSPDGREIAFVSDQSGSAEVWFAARDGSGARSLTTFGGPYTHSPRWSPDGGMLAFVSPVSGRFDLFVVGLDGGRPRRVGGEGFDYFAPTWSPDGRAVLAGAKRDGSHFIRRVPIDGGPPERLGEEGSRTPRMSSDGAWLYYTKAADSGIWRRPLRDTRAQAERVVRALAPVDWNNWALTERALFYVRRRESAEPELVRFDLASRDERIVRELPRLLHKSGLWIAPDETEAIATATVTAEADLMLIDRPAS